MTLDFLQRLQILCRQLGYRWGRRVGRLLVIGLLLIGGGWLGEHVWQLYAAPTITATKDAALLVDKNNNGLADPGDQLRYAITITNSSNGDLTGLQFSDTIPADTTLVAASLRTTPLAHNDSGYSTVGNVLLSVPVAQGVLLNDRDLDGGGLTVATYNAASANGGNVNVAPNGSFTYNPPPGYTGIDTFRYAVDDGDANRITATVTITVGQVVWFINNAVSTPGDGRFTAPFPSISAFMSQVANEPGDWIFIYSGAAPYNGLLTLLDQQQVIGQGSGLTLLPNLSIGAAARPILTNVTLASSNSLRGLTIEAANGIALNGNNVGGLIVSNVAVSSNGAAAVQLSGGSSAMTVTLDSVDVNGGVHGIDLLNNLGRIAINGGAIQNTSGHAISLINNTGPLDFTLRNSTLSNAAAGQNGLHLELPSGGSFGVVTVQNNTLRNNGSTGVRASVGGVGSIGKLEINNNTFTSNLSAVDLATNDQGRISFDIHDNATMTGDQTQINIAAHDPTHNDGIGPTMIGLIRNNRITLNPDGGAIGIWIVTDGDGNVTVDVATNRVNNFGESGIAVEALGGTGRVHARIVSNTVTTTATSSIAALYLRSGDGSSGESNLLCVNLSNNKMSAGVGADADYVLTQTTLATPFQLQDLSPAAASATQAADFVAATDGAPPATALASEGNYTRATCETVTPAAQSPRVAPRLARAIGGGWWSDPVDKAATMTHHSWPRLRFAGWPSFLTPAFLRFLQPSSAQAAGETVALNIGTLHADQPLVIHFAVKINQTFVGTEVCNQGTVMSGAVMSGAVTPVVTDDPSVVGSADPTCFAVVPPETTPPETTITDTPPNPSKSTAARFTFTGSDNVTPVENLTFECSLDNGDFAPCVTPLEYATLPEGLRIFQVRAVDAVGNVDPSPATFTWNINLVVTRPNLTATNSNDGGGSALLDQPWRWQITINNFGDGPAAFADGELLLLDHLPAAMISYETPTVTRSTDVSGVEQIRCTMNNADLHCRAEGGPVTIDALTGAITIEFNARATLAGDYANPRPGGRCLVDPDNRIDESDETNNGCADAVKVGLPDLTIAKNHFGDFIRGQAGAQFFMTVSNRGDVQSAGAVQVDDTLPVGLTATAMSGVGWLCTLTPLRCTRSDPLAPGAAYPQITLTVTVAEDAPLDLLNEATVTGGSDGGQVDNKATDLVHVKVLLHDLFLPIIQRE